MNKKLFSWKALAGLALLVAMGLTSCQQGNEVDPNDPTGSTKPVQPSVVDNKGADLTFTIKKAADLNTLWASYDAAKKTELMKKTTLNITINLSDFEIEATPITLPKFMNTVTNSLLNLTFTGNFKNADKQMFGLDLATNYTGAKANVVLPAAAFDFNLNAANVATALTSDGATIGKFFGTADNASANNALIIGNGVIIKAIDDTFAGKIVKNGGDIQGMIINTQPVAAQFVTKKGFTTLTGGSGFFTNNLIINAAGITITNDANTPLGDIFINKGCDLTLGFPNAIVKSITGTKASESKVTVLGWSIGNYGTLKNVEITNGFGFGIFADNFDGVKIDDPINLYAASLSNVTLGSTADINFYADGTTFTFNKVGFSGAGSLNLWGGVQVSQTPDKETYQWDIDQKIWVKVTPTAPIYAANAGDSGVEVSSDDVYYNNTTKQLDAYDGNLGGKIGDHKVVTIVWANAVYIQAENCALFINNCTMAGAALIDNNINNLFGWVNWKFTEPWFAVTLDGTAYSWKKSSNAGTYILVK